VYGLALVLMMRFKPEGLLPSRRVKAELHHDDGTAAPIASQISQSESTGAKA
jgi:branched-chain amino acid transport system permease protein